MQAPFSPDTVFRQSNRISSGSTIRKDGSFHRKSGSHRWQSAVADRYSQPARRYSCFGRVVQLDRADGTNSPLFTQGNIPILTACHIKCIPVFLPVKRIKITDEDHIGIRQFLIVLSASEQLHIDLAVVISAPLSRLSLTEHLHLYIVMCILFICRQYVQPYAFVLRNISLL